MPTELMPTELMPAELVPTEAMPAELMPTELMPTEATHPLPLLARYFAADAARRRLMEALLQK